MSELNILARRYVDNPKLGNKLVFFPVRLLFLVHDEAAIRRDSRRAYVFQAQQLFDSWNMFALCKSGTGGKQQRKAIKKFSWVHENSALRESRHEPSRHIPHVTHLCAIPVRDLARLTCSMRDIYFVDSPQRRPCL